MPQSITAKRHQVIYIYIFSYQNRTLNNKQTLENAINSLTNPGLFGKKNVEVAYLKATGEFIKQKTLRHKIKMDYTLKVLLFINVGRKDPDKGAEGTNTLDEESQNKYKRHLWKK